VRSYFYGRARGDFAYDTERLNIAGRTYTVLGWRLFRLQTTSESILLVLLVIGGVAEVVCTGSVLALAPNWWQAALIIVTLTCVMAVIAAVSRFAWVQRGDEFSSQSHQ
jgi:hypothetical protein